MRFFYVYRTLGIPKTNIEKTFFQLCFFLLLWNNMDRILIYKIIFNTGGSLGKPLCHKILSPGIEKAAGIFLISHHDTRKIRIGIFFRMGTKILNPRFQALS